MPTRFVTFTAACLTFLGITAHAAEVRTTQCSKHRHPEISFQVTNPAIPEEDRRWLVTSLEQMVASGSRFKAGQTLQLGWMLTLFEKGPDGTLRLQEPDMQAIPIKFVDSVDATLQTVRGHRDTVESFEGKLQALIPTLRQSIIVPPDVATVPGFSLVRDPAEEETESGWIMIGGETEPTEAQLSQYQLMSMYEFALRRPELLHLLAMPPGTVIKLPAQGPRSYFLDDKLLTVRAGSFIDQLDATLSRQRAGARL
ncbi:MAG: hypothetical protein ABW171_15330 [Steroidobacter sp.]